MFSITTNIPEEIYINIISMLIIEIIFFETSVSPSTTEFETLYILNKRETEIIKRAKFEAV